MNNTYLGVDLGRMTGVCLHHSDSDSVNVKTWDYSKYSHQEMFHYFLHDLSSLLVYAPVSHLVYEDVQFMVSRAQTNIWSGLRGILLACTYDIDGLEVIPCPTGTLKKFATGRGRASKADMIEAALTEDIQCDDDNQADAYWLTQYGKQRHSNQS